MQSTDNPGEAGGESGTGEVELLLGEETGTGTGTVELLLGANGSGGFPSGGDRGPRGATDPPPVVVFIAANNSHIRTPRTASKRTKRIPAQIIAFSNTFAFSVEHKYCLYFPPGFFQREHVQQLREDPFYSNELRPFPAPWIYAIF